MSDGQLYYLIPHIARAVAERLGEPAYKIIMRLGFRSAYDIAYGKLGLPYEKAIKIASAFGAGLHTLFSTNPPFAPLLPREPRRRPLWPSTRKRGRRNVRISKRRKTRKASKSIP